MASKRDTRSLDCGSLRLASVMLLLQKEIPLLGHHALVQQKRVMFARFQSSSSSRN